MRLSEFPYVSVRIACSRCGRQGRYRLARLADKYGSEVSLGKLLEMLVGECSQRGPKVRAYDYCGAHFRDLKSPRPPAHHRNLLFDEESLFPSREGLSPVSIMQDRGCPIVTSKHRPRMLIGARLTHGAPSCDMAMVVPFGDQMGTQCVRRDLDKAAAAPATVSSELKTNVVTTEGAVPLGRSVGCDDL